MSRNYSREEAEIKEGVKHLKKGVKLKLTGVELFVPGLEFIFHLIGNVQCNRFVF